MNLLFGDMRIYGILSLLIALVINFLILISFSNFNLNCKLRPEVKQESRLKCPSILFLDDGTREFSI